MRTMFSISDLGKLCLCSCCLIMTLIGHFSKTKNKKQKTKKQTLGKCWSTIRVPCIVHICNVQVVSSNPAEGEVYSIQLYVIKFISDLRQVGGFLRVLRHPPPIQLTVRYNWNIVERGHSPIFAFHMNKIPYETNIRFGESSFTLRISAKSTIILTSGTPILFLQTCSKASAHSTSNKLVNRSAIVVGWLLLMCPGM
jgi:hypothetical protein